MVGRWCGEWRGWVWDCDWWGHCHGRDQKQSVFWLGDLCGWGNLVRRWWGTFLASENMNGVGVGTEKIKKRVYGGKYPGGGMVRDFLAKLHANYFRAVSPTTKVA